MEQKSLIIQKSEHFTYDSNKKVNGIEVLDMIDGETYAIKAKKLLMLLVLGLMK